MKRSCYSGLLTLVLCSGMPPCLAPAARAQHNYNLVDLGSLGGWAQTGAINTEGWVVGSSLTTEGVEHAFLWKEGDLTDLGVAPGFRSSSARVINAAGQIAGTMTAADGTRHAFLWENGVMADLGPLGGGGSYTYGLTEDGCVLGYSYPQSGTPLQAFCWDRDNGLQSVTDLLSLGGPNAIAAGRNPSGWLIGASNHTQDPNCYHAVLHHDGMTYDLGSLGGTNSSAVALNAAGQIVGSAFLPNNMNFHAFRWNDGVLQDLGTLGGGNSGATAINSFGHVVGWALKPDGAMAAFLFTDGVMQELNSFLSPGSGWDLAIATGVNDRGQICGYGQLVRDGKAETRAFLLMPITE